MKTVCPCCGAPAEVTTIGLDQVANTGDETLARKEYRYVPPTKQETPRVLITGSRDWNDFKLVEKELSQFPPGTTVIHGACRGADKIAGYIARQLGFKVEEYPAQWNKYGKRAGMLRNEEMATRSACTYVLAFHDDPNLGRGTAHMVRLIRRRGMPVKWISHSGIKMLPPYEELRRSKGEAGKEADGWIYRSKTTNF